MKILFLCHRIPYPPDKGDKIRSFNEIVYLSKQHDIYLATILDRESDAKFLSTLNKYCKRVFAVQFNRKIRLLKSLFSGRPFSISNFYCRDLQKFIDETLSKNNIDAIICYCSSMAEYIFNNPKFINNQLGNKKLIMDFVDLDSDKWSQFSKYANFPSNIIYQLENKRLLDYEIKVNNRFDYSIFVSKREVDAFKAFHPTQHNVHVISNGVDYEYFKPSKTEYPSLNIDSEPTIVFTGVMDYFANEDGVCWFCEKIFPKIRSCFRKARFYIVGNRPTRRVRALSSQNGVHVTGYVEDIREYYLMADICVTPLRIARGLQNKVLEAMATGNAVVASSNASEGIICHKDQDIIIADNEETFSQAIIDLLQDGERRKNLGSKAMENIRKNYSWDSNLQKLDEILEPGPP